VLARWKGALFFGYYLAYLLYVWLAAAQHQPCRCSARSCWRLCFPDDYHPGRSGDTSLTGRPSGPRVSTAAAKRTQHGNPSAE
jgi:hypothetical protein